MTDSAGGQRQRRPMQPRVPALRIPADVDKPVQVIDLVDADHSLAILQAEVGGLVDVQAHGEGDLWVNDEGRLIDLPVNVRASHWVLNRSAAAENGLVGEHSVLYGDVVMTGPPDAEGDITPVDPAMVSYFEGLHVDRDALKDWDIRSVAWTVTDWPELPEPGDGMEL